MKKKNKAGHYVTLVIIIIGAIVLTGMLYLDHTRKIDNSKKFDFCEWNRYEYLLSERTGNGYDFFLEKYSFSI